MADVPAFDTSDFCGDWSSDSSEAEVHGGPSPTAERSESPVAPPSDLYPNDITISEMVDIIGILSSGIKTRMQLSREATRREACILLHGFVRALGSATYRGREQRASQQLMARTDGGLVSLKTIVKHPVHLAVAAFIVAMKHHQETTPYTNLVALLPRYSGTGVDPGSEKEICIEAKSLELILVQLTARDASLQTTPEHSLRLLMMVLSKLVRDLLPVKVQVARAAQILLEEALVLPVILHAGDCCFAALAIACALFCVSVSTSTVQEINLMQRNRPEYAALPRLNAPTLKACVQLMVENAPSETRKTIESAVTEFAGTLLED